MNISVILQMPNQQILDITEVTSTVSWATTLSSQPGKLRFSIPVVKSFDIPMGSTINLMVEGIGIFFGYVFEARYESDMIYYTAFDSIRYLKNKETYIFSGKTATQIFVAICDDFNLKYRVVDQCNWEVSPRTHDGKTLYQIIDYGYKEALVNTQDWFIVRDNYGVIEQISLRSLKTNYLFSDIQNLSKYKYRKSIDKDSYNRIKLVQDNTKEAVRKVYVVQDDNNQRNWGVLQYYEKVDKNASEQQIKERAQALLKLKNRETKELTVECVGAPNDLRAGNWIFLEINPLIDAGFQNFQDYIITHCTHTWENNDHKVRMQVSQYSLGVNT